jgi:hypothetical protein
LRVAWVGLNLLVALAMALGAAAGPPGSTRLAYVVLLFALCSSPLLQMRQLNDRFALLGVFGAVLWLIGTAAVLTLNIVVVPEKTNDSVSQGLTQLGPWKTAIVILGNHLQPLGGVVIAYGCAKSRSKALVARGARRCDGVPGAAGLPRRDRRRRAQPGRRASGLQRRAALQARKSVLSGAAAERAQTIFERSNLKPSVELAVSATGRGTPFQYGRTLEPLLSTFIPRLLWAKKPDIAVG